VNAGRLDRNHSFGKSPKKKGGWFHPPFIVSKLLIVAAEAEIAVGVLYPQELQTCVLRIVYIVA